MKRRELVGHFGKVYTAHWAGDSIHLVSAAQDGKMIVWNAMNTFKVQNIHLKSHWVMTCAFEKNVLLWRTKSFFAERKLGLPLYMCNVYLLLRAQLLNIIGGLNSMIISGAGQYF